jgi:DNA-binding NarL/FixJ family response regulator
MRILVVDDHPMMAEAIRIALLTLDHSAQIECTADLDGALASTSHEGAFDLVLLDLGLPHCSGLQALTLFREARPGQAVVVVSGSSGRELILAALESGAMGFIPKTAPGDVVRHAVQLIASGGIYVPIEALKPAHPAASDGGRSASSSTSVADLGLTPRQAEVLSLLLKGLSNKLIARRLDIAENTVKVHVQAVLRALGAETRTQALIAATRRGLRLGV